MPDRPLAAVEALPGRAERPTGGRLNADLARAVVRAHRDCTGRGPTKAQAFFRHNVVVCVVQSVLTRAERSLVEAGRSAAVVEGRRELQATMRPQLVSAVEELTGCRVTAFLSDNHVEPDVGVEVFVLDRPVPSPGAGDGPPQ
jgi:uncharacterized protein YbcI